MMSLNELSEEERDLFIKIQLENYKTSANTVTGPSTEGYFGAVYVICSDRESWVAKCPNFKKFDGAEKTRDHVLKLINEFAKSYAYYHNPWVNRVFDIQIYMGWPFIFWSFKDATLTDLIRNPLNWNLSQKYSILIMIIRGLLKARDHGLSAHQDLKPDNILVTDRAKRLLPGTRLLDPFVRFHPVIADLATADAFLDDAKLAGSKPYKAPEQYEIPEMVDLGLARKIDDFAMCVIATEVLSNGVHPIGVVTHERWPSSTGTWSRDTKWKKWARSDQKELPKLDDAVSAPLRRTLVAGMSVKPTTRPELNELEVALWRDLESHDPQFTNVLRMFIKHTEGLYVRRGWPFMEELLKQVRTYYSQRQ